PLLLEHRHVIPDRRRRDTEVVTLGDRLGAHRLVRGDVILHDGTKHRELPVVDQRAHLPRFASSHRETRGLALCVPEYQVYGPRARGAITQSGRIPSPDRPSAAAPRPAIPAVRDPGTVPEVHDLPRIPLTTVSALPFPHHPSPGAEATAVARSEERRVGKECRSRWAPYQ